jgi:hypothetical protein
MSKYLLAIAGAAAILAVAAPAIVNAGGTSTSAATKYSHQARSDQLRADRNFPITEYSSSSRRTQHTQKHQH